MDGRRYVRETSSQQPHHAAPDRLCHHTILFAGRVDHGKDEIAELPRVKPPPHDTPAREFGAPVHSDSVCLEMLYVLQRRDARGMGISPQAVRGAVDVLAELPASRWRATNSPTPARPRTQRDLFCPMPHQLVQTPVSSPGGSSATPNASTRYARLVRSSSAKWHAVSRASTFRSGGVCVRQMSFASQQRGWKRQPAGGSSGEGGSPVRT